MPNEVPQFDPDKYMITKDDVLLVMNAIEQRWTQSLTSSFKNSKFVMSMEAMKLGIKMTDEETISIVWHDILLAFNELIRLNAMYRMKNEMPNSKQLLDLAIAKIKSGEVFKKSKLQIDLESKRDNLKKTFDKIEDLEK